MARRLLLLTVFLSLSIAAQARPGARTTQSFGELRLEVKDPSGKALEAAGKLDNLATGVSNGFQTDSQGKRTFEGLAYGRYRLEVSREGFATQSMLINVQSNETVTRAVILALSSLAYKSDVIATTPLPGVDLEPNEVPTPVQAATKRDIEMSGAINLSDFLNRRLSGVFVNEIQNNPFQPDVNYRGYTASPLLGTPQGLSVYMDGVRLNQPFGDVVSWDLIPRIAIAEIGSVAKNGWGRKKLGPDSSLGGALEEALHESHLSANVAFPESFNLALPNHVHCLEPADRPPRRLESEEAESGIDSTFDESVVLLDYVIEVLGLA